MVLQSGELGAGTRFGFDHSLVVICGSKGVVVLQLRQIVLDNLLPHVTRLYLLILAEQACPNILVLEVVIRF